MSVLKSQRELRKTGKGLTDENLWQTFAAGDDSAYTLLYFRYADKLYAYLRMVLQSGENRNQIDDIFQETWLKIYDERERFEIRGGGSFSGWLFRIAHNFAISYVRRPQHSVLLEDLSRETQQSAPFTSTNEPLSDERSADEMLILLRKTVESLPLSLREIYILSEYENMDLDRIADALSITRQNAKVRLFRARKEVRIRLLRLIGVSESSKIHNEEDNI
jgi:RNA polymerase sigma-70 factor (ECF subfamily)